LKTRKANKTVYIILVAAVLLYGIINAFYYNDKHTMPTITTPVTVSGQLKLHFIDVGQADSILIQAPSGKVMLIDAGNNGDTATITNYIKALGISKIDILLGSHPHEDHVGSLDTVVNSFNIGSICMPKVLNTTKTYEDVLAAIKNKGLQVTTAVAGVQLDLGEGVKADMLAPNGTSYDDLNNWSVVVKITFGNNSFLLTGDAETISEKEMIAKGYDLNADLLKVGHHGSSSSTSIEFLSKVNPKYAIISVGNGNDYKHPHKTTMTKLQDRGIAVYRTDQNKTIIATSDGNNITFNTKPGNYNYAD